MLPADLGYVARLHQENLEPGFFGQLGHRFLSRYYETFIASPYAVAVAVGDPALAMLVGTTHNELHYRWMFRHRGLRLALSGGLALIRRPMVLLDFVRTRTGRYLRAVKRVARRSSSGQGQGQGQGAGTVNEQVAVLVHVAVSAKARRQRLGAALVEAFITPARLAGADRALLVTLDGSGGASDFYISLGWDHVASKVDNDGRSLKVFELSLKEGA